MAYFFKKNKKNNFLLLTVYRSNERKYFGVNLNGSNILALFEPFRFPALNHVPLTYYYSFKSGHIGILMSKS